MRFDEFDLPTADGVEVHVRRWRPDSEPRAVVQIAHGMAEPEVRVYSGARHELVNETNRDEVHVDVLAFLERTLG